MEFLNYFIVSVIVYIGLVAGWVILKLAPEEKKPGMKYFTAIEKILFIIFILAAIYFNHLNWVYLVIIIVLAGLYYFLNNLKIYVTYLLFSCVLFFSFHSILNFTIFSVIMFGYGLVAGAILFEPKKKWYKLLYFLYFITIANILMLVL